MKLWRFFRFFNFFPFLDHMFDIVEKLFYSLPCDSTRGLHQHPLTTSSLIEAEESGDVCCVGCAGEILLVGNHDDWEAGSVCQLHQVLELQLGLVQSL